MRRIGLLTVVIVAVVLGFTAWDFAQTSAPEPVKKTRRRADANVAADSKHRITIEAARMQAAQMHGILESTLHAMHRNYFHRDRDRVTVPARAMQAIFADIARDYQIDAHWIAVNTHAMSLDHEPADEFERAAARELAAGKDLYEKVDNGSYRRAGSIALGGSCIICHTSASFGPPSAKPKYAGLVISVPVTGENESTTTGERGASAP